MTFRLILTIACTALFATADTNQSFAPPPQADPPVEFDGYTYIIFGTEAIRYQEHTKNSSGSTTITVDSDVEVISPVYISGSLTRVNETFDFSMEGTSTLLPTHGTESWKVEVDSGSSSATYDPAQDNRFDLLASSMQFLFHYKATPRFRYIGGLLYTLNSFKRYQWKSYTNLVSTNDTLIEERYASLVGSVGVWYENAPAASQLLHYRLRALIGAPLWQETTNTAEEYGNLVFTSTEGHNLNLDAYAGLRVYPGIELGGFFGYDQQYRAADETVNAGSGRVVTWPENRLAFFRYGAMIVWKFRE